MTTTTTTTTTEATTSEAARTTKPPVHSGGEHRLRSENLAFDIDVWYPPLAKHTFATIFLPLSRHDAQAIVAYYNFVHRHVRDDDGLNEEVVAQLVSLEEQLDQVLAQNFGGAAFVRLCGRSPKDGEPTDPSLRAEIWESYCQELEKLELKLQEPPQESIDDNNDNDNDNDNSNKDEKKDPTNEDNNFAENMLGNARVAAMAHTQSTLRVRNGKETMALLLNSERVFSDMLDWLHYGEPEQIVLRQFCNDFDLSTEFRCYIRPGGILCGMSQYDTYARHAFLQDPATRARIVKAVVDEWSKVKDCIETMDGSYCVDFGVDMATGRAHLIEISPFRRCTGPALFAWKKNKQADGEEEGAELLLPERLDVQDDLIAPIMQSGRQHTCIAKNAVFRVRSQVISGIGDLVEMNWDYRWSKDRWDTPKPHHDIYTLTLNTNNKKRTTDSGSWWSQLRSWWVQDHQEQSPPPPQQQQQHEHVLFVYGTLKRNCHWHGKYMTGARFLGEGTTVQPQSLVIGACGVPYLIRTSSGHDPNAKPVRGEVWRISSDMLQGIDDYEGIQKGHYTREQIDIDMSSTRQDGTIQTAFCYFYAVKPGKSDVDVSLLQAPRIFEYPAEEQKKRYKPIHHIQVKQLQYLGEASLT